MSQILCAGPHPTPVVLGTTDTPAVALGALCSSCGLVYVEAVNNGSRPAGHHPTADDVTAYVLRHQPTAPAAPAAPKVP